MARLKAAEQKKCKSSSNNDTQNAKSKTQDDSTAIPFIKPFAAKTKAMKKESLHPSKKPTLGEKRKMENRSIQLNSVRIKQRETQKTEIHARPIVPSTTEKKRAFLYNGRKTRGNTNELCCVGTKKRETRMHIRCMGNINQTNKNACRLYSTRPPCRQPIHTPS